MLLKNILDELMSFMSKEGESLGLSKENMEKITVENVETLRFRFPSHTSQLELIRMVTTKVAAWIPDFSEDDLDDIGLALDEACANVVRHSYIEGQEGLIFVEYTLEPKKITIKIVDEGAKGQKFNLDTLSPVDKEEYLNTLSRGGLGVHIIKKIMDEVTYTVSPGHENCLTMVKYAS